MWLCDEYGGILKEMFGCWAGHVACKGRDACKVLVEKPDGNRPLGRPMYRLENNIKMALQEVCFGGMDWINLTEDRDRRRAVVNAVMTLQNP
jgi:hypothetical protein